MAIAFVNAGTPTQANSSPQSPGLPTNHAAGDLMLLICEQTSAAAITFAASGFVSIARNSNATRTMTLEVLAKIEGVGESAPSVTCSSAAGGWQATVVNYRGVNNTVIEDVADVSSDAAAATTWQPTGISLTTVNDMVLSVVASKDDNALNLSVANGYTVRVSGATYDGTTGNGSDYSLGVAEQLFASTGAKTCPTWNQSANGTDAWVGLTIALLAAVPVSVAPTAAAMTLTGATPTVAVTANNFVVPDAAALTFTGATPAVTQAANGVVVVTGGGVYAQAAAPGKTLGLTATGGGVLSWDAEAVSVENHDGSLTATGGGVLLTASTSAHAGVAVLTGGGVATVTTLGGHRLSTSATGGGVIVASTVAGRQSSVRAAGGGVLAVASTSAHTASSASTGGGVLQPSWVGAHRATMAPTGSGQATISGTQGEAHDGHFAVTGGGVFNVTVEGVIKPPGFVRRQVRYRPPVPFRKGSFHVVGHGQLRIVGVGDWNDDDQVLDMLLAG